jgi:bifunctional DNase/RNase
MVVKGLTLDPLTNMPIVILKDVEGNRALPIWIGANEANAIAMEMEHIDAPSHDSRPHSEYPQKASRQGVANRR